MNDNNFDKSIKVQLAGYNSPINVDELWTTIEPKIISISAPQPFNDDQKTSDFSKKAIWAVLAALAVALSAYYIYNNVNNSNNSNNNGTFAPVIESDINSENIESLQESKDKGIIFIEEIRTDKTKTKENRESDPDKIKLINKKKVINNKKPKKVGEIVPGSDPL